VASETAPEGNEYSARGLLIGLAVFIALLLLPAPAGMPDAAWRVVAVAALMAIWWLTEALPLAATALLPVALFPLLGILKIEAAAAPYADPVIFLFLGGLALGLATEKWGLHRRIALRLVGALGTRPGALILGFMTATAAISMWVSNTATAAMMLPVTLSIVGLLAGAPATRATLPREQADFPAALLIGVAYAASIGGIATLIGTPPNALFAGFMHRTYGITIGFAQWMLVGVPVAAVLLVLTWLAITRVAFRIPRAAPEGLAERLAAEIAALPRMGYPEAAVSAVFLLTAAAWLFRPALAVWMPGLNDTVIAVAAALALFILPSRRGGALLDWAAAERLPWGILLLFGGGLSLAAGIGESGLAAWVGAQLRGIAHLPSIAVVLVLVAVTIAMSELASNTATAAAFLPLAASLAQGIGAAPAALTLPVVLAASCGFMLPVATPPNAIFFGSGYITVRQMARAGILADLIGAALILAASLVLVPLAFG
jgi:solute carrier family 13 (sodium-dependent dicarboxylate transporter), member 2/3/5